MPDEWIALKPIPDKTSHHNVPHVQSIDFAGHTDGKCGTCGRAAREIVDIGKGGFVRNGFGWYGMKHAKVDVASSQTWLLAIFTRERSFALFCALLRSFALFCGLAFAPFKSVLICTLLRSFACFCVRPRLERPRLGTADDKSNLSAGEQCQFALR